MHAAVCRAAVVFAAVALSACVAQPLAGRAGPVGTVDEGTRQQTHYIPFDTGGVDQTLLLGRVCRPDGVTPARVVVLAHGSPPVASQRLTQQLTSCDSEAVRWFTGRGYMVVLSIRRGYGGTGGPYVEGAQACTVDSYARAAQETARDVLATVAYGLALPGAKTGGAVVVGQSAGGWGALGVNAVAHPGVMAIVSMAGGRGGHVGNQANSNCHPENLAGAAGTLGRTASIPMLWIYTENDSYFAPPIARSLYDSFTAAGGRADFHALPAFGQDGHGLFFGRGGSAVWGPLVERYLRDQGAT